MMKDSSRAIRVRQGWRWACDGSASLISRAADSPFGTSRRTSPPSITVNFTIIAKSANGRRGLIDRAGGRQPVWNESQDVAVIYNGELYNYRELRERLTLLGPRFAPKS